MLIFFASGVDHDALVKLAEKQFSGLRSTYEESDVPEPCRFTGSEVGGCRKLEGLALRVNTT